ncbi:hypothetical protein CRM95_33160 [Burkholderia gladioli]|nr:hypothetical protein CO712_23330 [Burkholderia gladioli pv. gladioli]PEH82894.1 hypothetical protein CRM95_33160 [Burkholderia gladioli]
MFSSWPGSRSTREGIAFAARRILSDRTGFKSKILANQLLSFRRIQSEKRATALQQRSRGRHEPGVPGACRAARMTRNAASAPREALDET